MADARPGPIALFPSLFFPNSLVQFRTVMSLIYPEELRAIVGPLMGVNLPAVGLPCAGRKIGEAQWRSPEA